MTMFRLAVLSATAAMTLLAATADAAETPAAGQVQPATVPARPEIYAPFTLQADLSSLTDKERRMLGLFIEAASSSRP